MRKTEIIDSLADRSVGFDDADCVKDNGMPEKIRVFSGAAVDSVQLIYNGSEPKKHGGNGGGLSEGALKDGSYIKKIRATLGTFAGTKVLTALAFYDQDGKKIAGNEREGIVKELEAGDGEYICAIFGRTVKAGGLELLSAIGAYMGEMPELNGIMDVFKKVQDIKI